MLSTAGIRYDAVHFARLKDQVDELGTFDGAVLVVPQKAALPTLPFHVEVFA